MPVHNHMAGSFRKGSSTARRTEAKRARFFARQQTLASISPRPAHARRGADDAERERESAARPPLDLVPIRAGDGSLGEASAAQAEVALRSPSAGGARRPTVPASPPNAPTPCTSSPTARAAATPACVARTPPRGGGSQPARATPPTFPSAPDLISRRCYEHASDAWASLNGSLFEQMPYEPSSHEPHAPAPPWQPTSAPRAGGGVGGRGLGRGAPSEPLRVHGGEGLLVEPEQLQLGGSDGDDDDDDGSGDGFRAAPARGGFHHHVVVQQATYHWRSAHGSPFAAPQHWPSPLALGFTPISLGTPAGGGRRRAPRRAEPRATCVSFDELDEGEGEEAMIA
ncbi:hypothetical protein KFE25_001395 [Diacronema lutheri]|uniref:Uncharacterized protein n=1 Tax=Diacronema lutheri TaxID=2081491 RepID=A0A8J5XII3_DIALT|nr:hypothetical protein KFE25_001395 [Diacronema lutheri]